MKTTPVKFAVLALLAAAALRADVKPSTLFSDHVVLQRDMPVPVWGTAAAGEPVTVAFAGQTKATTAGADGKWRVDLAPLTASAEGRVLTISGADPAKAVTCADVLVGEVWICSGQSNMDFTVSKAVASFAGIANEAEEIAAAHYPLIREFRGRPDRIAEPQANVTATWKVCSPETVPAFSAVAYIFARQLQKDIKVPVGLLTLTFGASTAQAWVRREALAADPELIPLLDAFDAKMEAFRNAPATPAPAATPPAAAPAAGVAQNAGTPNAAGGAAARGARAGRAARGPSSPATDQHNPTVLYNGLIAPVVPYAVRGVIWYQGESITGSLPQFAKLNATLINDWRTLWGRPSGATGVVPFPFYFVQLAGLANSGSNRPEVREAQTAALTLPDTGMAVATDIGEANAVHPKNKQDVGDRLARIALANTYGRKIEFSGPVYDAMKVEGGAIRVTFTHLGGGLVAKGNAPLKWFSVAGADQKFVPAEAKIVGDTVVVSSPGVPAPVAVRYAWERFPDGCNLFNAAGLPAPQFRTDKW